MSGTLRALLVEDNLADAHMIRRYLRETSELDVELTHQDSHKKALDVLRRSTFDFILVDYKLPGKNGFNTLRFLSTRDEPTPVIMLTGNGNEQAAIKAFRLGACDYIPKGDLSPRALNQAILNGLIRSQRRKQRERRIESLKTKVERDELTSLLNRRALRNRLKEEVSRARRYQNQLSLLMIDLDEFKSINDEHGHVVGDRVLKNVARRLRRKLRETDVAGRYGGDEFCIIVTQTNLEGAKQLGMRLLEELNGRFEWNGTNEISIRCSIGAAQLRQDDNNIDRFIDRADKAMYRAKQKGGCKIANSLPG